MQAQKKTAGGIRNLVPRGQVFTLMAVVLGCLVWGFSYMFTKIAQRSAPPLVQLSIRFIIVIILMSLLVLFKVGKLEVRRKGLIRWLAVSMLDPIYMGFESFTIFFSNSTFVGVAMAMAPVVSIILAAVFLHEYPTRRQACFVLLPIVGVIMVTVAGTQLGVVGALGVVLACATCLMASMNRVLYKKACETYTTFEITYGMMLMSAVSFTAAALITEGGDLSAYAAALESSSFIFATIMLSVFCSVVGYLAYNYGIPRLPMVIFATCGTLTTVCSMFVGIIFLHEPMNATSMLGSVLILVGIWQVTRPTRSAETETAAAADVNELTE